MYVISRFFYSKDKKSLNQISNSETSSVGDARRARLASLDAKMTPPKVRTTRVLIGCFWCQSLPPPPPPPPSTVNNTRSTAQKLNLRGTKRPVKCKDAAREQKHRGTHSFLEALQRYDTELAESRQTGPCWREKGLFVSELGSAKGRGKKWSSLSFCWKTTLWLGYRNKWIGFLSFLHLPCLWSSSSTLVSELEQFVVVFILFIYLFLCLYVCLW